MSFSSTTLTSIITANRIFLLGILEACLLWKLKLSFGADVEVKLTPLSSSKFSSGRPTEQAQALGTFVKTSIVE